MTSPPGKVRISLVDTHHKDLGIVKKMNIGGNIRLNPIGLAIVTFLVLLVLFFQFRSSGDVGFSAERSGMLSMKQLLSVSIEASKRGGLEVKKIREMVIYITINISDYSYSSSRDRRNVSLCIFGSFRTEEVSQ